MTRITRIIMAALAALAIGAPIATAMPTDASGTPQTATTAPAQTDTPSACTAGTRPVHGPYGTGCTTSPPNDTDLGVFALVVTGAGSFALALGAGATAGRRRDRAATTAALSGHTS
jgi:hypothetical protein